MRDWEIDLKNHFGSHWNEKTRRSAPEYFQITTKITFFPKNKCRKKNTFCNMRFKEIHWLNILKSRIFHEDSIAKDFVWRTPLVFEKIPFYLSKSCGLRPQIYISMQKKIILIKLSHLWSSSLRHWKIHHFSLNAT